MKKRTLITMLLLLCAVFVLRMGAGADFGNFSGDTDYGGYSDYDYDYDYNYDYDYDDDGYSSSGDVDLMGVIIMAAFILIPVAIGQISKNRSAKKTKSAKRGASGGGRSGGDLAPIGEYTRLDPGFSAAALCEKAANLYVQMQNGWTAKDIEPLRPYFTDALFTQMERALQDIVKRGETNMVERIAVLEVAPQGFRQSAGEDIITLRLRTRIIDYTVNDSTQELVSGHRDREKFMTYEWDMLRPSGITTSAEGDATKRISCPGCGAPLDVNASARCPYCGAVIRQSAQDWVISAIRGIRQETR